MGHTEVASLAALGSLSVTAVAYYLASRPKGTLPDKSTIRKLVVTRPDADLEQVKIVVEEVPMPTVEYGQVLVKMEAVPVVSVVFHAPCSMFHRPRQPRSKDFLQQTKTNTPYSHLYLVLTS